MSFFSRAATLVASVAVIACAGSALAVNVPMSAKVGPCPTTPGEGLNGKGWFYNTSDTIWADMYAHMTEPADFMYMSRLVNTNGSTGYVNNSESNVQGLLGSSSMMIMPDSAGTHAIDGVILRYTGYICISQPTTLTFGVLSDDGFQLDIGGIRVAEFVGQRGPGVTTGEATFSMAGLYAIDLLYFANNQGTSGVNLLWNGGGNAGTVNGAGDLTLVPTEVLFKVPAPGAAALVGMGGLLASRRRR
jgi:hypothetical protein